MNTIKIMYDYYKANPRTERDNEPPLITRWGRGYWDHEYWIDIIDIIRSKLNNKNMYAIADLLWYSREDIKNRVNKYLNYDACSVVKDLLYELKLEDIGFGEIEGILDILKIEYYRWTSKWYSQWDVVYCILIATDERIEENGINRKNIKREFETHKKLYDQRAWETPMIVSIYKTIKLYNNKWKYYKDEYEFVDCCSGFYDAICRFRG